MGGGGGVEGSLCYKVPIIMLCTAPYKKGIYIISFLFLHERSAHNICFHGEIRKIRNNIRG